MYSSSPFTSRAFGAEPDPRGVRAAAARAQAREDFYHQQRYYTDISTLSPNFRHAAVQNYLPLAKEPEAYATGFHEHVKLRMGKEELGRELGPVGGAFNPRRYVQLDYETLQPRRMFWTREAVLEAERSVKSLRERSKALGPGTVNSYLQKRVKTVKDEHKHSLRLLNEEHERRVMLLHDSYLFPTTLQAIEQRRAADGGDEPPPSTDSTPSPPDALEVVTVKVPAQNRVTASGQARVGDVNLTPNQPTTKGPAKMKTILSCVMSKFPMVNDRVKCLTECYPSEGLTIKLKWFRSKSAVPIDTEEEWEDMPEYSDKVEVPVTDTDLGHRFAVQACAVPNDGDLTGAIPPVWCESDRVQRRRPPLCNVKIEMVSAPGQSMPATLTPGMALRGLFDIDSSTAALQRWVRIDGMGLDDTVCEFSSSEPSKYQLTPADVGCSLKYAVAHPSAPKEWSYSLPTPFVSGPALPAATLPPRTQPGVPGTPSSGVLRDGEPGGAFPTGEPFALDRRPSQWSDPGSHGSRRGSQLGSEVDVSRELHQMDGGSQVGSRRGSQQAAAGGAVGEASGSHRGSLQDGGQIGSSISGEGGSRKGSVQEDHGSRKGSGQSIQEGPSSRKGSVQAPNSRRSSQEGSVNGKGVADGNTGAQESLSDGYGSRKGSLNGVERM